MKKHDFADQSFMSFHVVVVHVVGPDFNKDVTGSVAQCVEMLANAYHNLFVAVSHMCAIGGHGPNMIGGPPGSMGPRGMMGPGGQRMPGPPPP